MAPGNSWGHFLSIFYVNFELGRNFRSIRAHLSPRQGSPISMLPVFRRFRRGPWFGAPPERPEVQFHNGQTSRETLGNKVCGTSTNNESQFTIQKRANHQLPVTNHFALRCRWSSLYRSIFRLSVLR